MRHHVAIQMEKEKQYQEDNGPIVKTVDQLWKYSGKTEETDPSFLKYIKEEEKHAREKMKLLIKFQLLNRYGKHKK